LKNALSYYSAGVVNSEVVGNGSTLIELGFINLHIPAGTDVMVLKIFPDLAFFTKITASEAKCRSYIGNIGFQEKCQFFTPKIVIVTLIPGTNYI
jgi:hypothetical protein